MKDFLQRAHGAIRENPAGLNEKISHLTLPAIIYLTLCHASPRTLEIFRLQISDQEAVIPQKQGVVPPSGFSQGRLHLWPHLAMAFPVLCQPLRFDLQYEANSLHLPPTVEVRLAQESFDESSIHRDNVPGGLAALLPG